MCATAFQFNVRIRTKARTEGFCGRIGDRVKFGVAAAPEKGRANQRLCELLAAFFNVPVAQVAVVSGHTSRDKRVAVQGITPERGGERLAELGP